MDTSIVKYVKTWNHFEIKRRNAVKMKRTFVYILLVTMLFEGNSLLVSNVHSAENKVISFLSNETGNYDIFIIGTDGRVRERYATNAMRKSSLTCSFEGYLFAYSSNENVNLDIYKMDIRNKEPIRLTQHPKRDLWPAWSPNGKWIAFVSDREGTQDIYRMDVDGSNIIRLTNEGTSGRPAWSPDSQLIAFEFDRGINHSIYTMNTDGGQLKQVTEGLQLWPGCTWSPDGQQIAFAAGNLTEEGVDIYTIDVDGRNIEKLTNMGKEIRSGNPAWSPDGDWIAYAVAEVDEWPNPANGFKLIFSDSTIYIVDSTGKNGEMSLEETTGLSSDHVPVWTSPNFFSVSPDENKQTVTWGKLKTLIFE